MSKFDKTIMLTHDQFTGEPEIFICGDDIYGYYKPEDAFKILNDLFSELLEAWADYRKELSDETQENG